MKRSLFLKSLLGILAAPKLLAEVKPTPKEPFALEYVREQYRISKFKTVYREAIRNCTFPKIKRWVVADIDNICRLENITYVDKEVNGTRYGVIVRYSYFIHGPNPSEVEIESATSRINAEGLAILASDYQPNEMFDFIIIG